MAKPQTIQELKPNKFIWPRIFPFFAATWNWLVNAFDNLRGDYDVNRREGFITIDKTNADRQVIRFRKDRLMSFLNNALKESPGCFEPTFNEATGEYSVSNPYYRVGGKTYTAGIDTSAIVPGEITALRIDASSSQPSATLVSYGDISSLNAAEDDLRYYIIPLYILGSDSKITCDFRKGAIAVMSEF